MSAPRKWGITGASGPFGSGVVRTLVQQHGISPQQLVLVSRSPDRLDEWAASGADVRRADFDNGTALTEALRGVDRLLMISTSRVGGRAPQHRTAIEAARDAGVRHVVYTSFVGKAQYPAISVREHRFTEDLLQASGMAWTILRNSQYAEAMRDAGGPAALRSGTWISSSGNGRIAMVSREDCIRSAAAVMAGSGHEGHIYDITGPALVTFAEVCALIAKITGHPIDYRPVDDEGLYAFFDRCGIPRSTQDNLNVDGYGWCSDEMVSFEASLRAGAFAVLSDHVKQLTGQAPESIDSFLARHRDTMLRAAGLPQTP
jgi:NAD(P)H dehydrogenase (quinone)